MQGSSKRASHPRPTSPLSRLWCGPKKDGAIRKTGPNGIQWDQIHPPTSHPHPTSSPTPRNLSVFQSTLRVFQRDQTFLVFAFRWNAAGRRPSGAREEKQRGGFIRRKRKNCKSPNGEVFGDIFFFSTVSIKHGQECYSLRIVIIWFYNFNLSHPISSQSCLLCSRTASDSNINAESCHTNQSKQRNWWISKSDTHPAFGLDTVCWFTCTQYSTIFTKMTISQ